MVQLSQLARIRQERHQAWLEQMRNRPHALGKTQKDAEAESQSPNWRAIFAEAVILYKHNS